MLVQERETFPEPLRDADEAVQALCALVIELGEMVRKDAAKDALRGQAAVVGAVAVRMIEDIFMRGEGRQ